MFFFNATTKNYISLWNLTLFTVLSTLLLGCAVKINCLCKPYCCLHWLWIAGDQMILFSQQKKALKLIFCFCFISDYFKKSDSVHCCLAVQSRSIAFASLIVACIGFELLVIKRSFFPCCWKTSPKRFSASKCDVGNWIFSKSYKFFDKLFAKFFNFLGEFFSKVFLE